MARKKHNVKDVDMEALLREKKAAQHSKERLAQDVKNKEREIIDNEYMIELSKREVKLCEEEIKARKKISETMLSNYGVKEPKNLWEENPEYWVAMKGLQKVLDEREIMRLESSSYVAEKKVRNGEEAIKSLKTALEMQRKELEEKENE